MQLRAVHIIFYLNEQLFKINRLNIFFSYILIKIITSIEDIKSFSDSFKIKIENESP